MMEENNCRNTCFLWFKLKKLEPGVKETTEGHWCLAGGQSKSKNQKSGKNLVQGCWRKRESKKKICSLKLGQNKNKNRKNVANQGRIKIRDLSEKNEPIITQFFKSKVMESKEKSSSKNRKENPDKDRHKVGDEVWVMNTNKSKLQPDKVGPAIILKDKILHHDCLRPCKARQKQQETVLPATKQQLVQYGTCAPDNLPDNLPPEEADPQPGVCVKTAGLTRQQGSE
ncbi:hypothetical protein DSO57_1037803 [Entomophthora muscae]|uniref:Uncharacterized protein n=1 Tax=Entomophthora muscae TaxID=34485 RepID=A0ACC2TL87_9FUNG|nr:hypothetical protein DSO57_1037803 [Entomophthora muscae]